MHDPTLLLRGRPSDATPDWVSAPTGEHPVASGPPPWLAADAAAPEGVSDGDDTLVLRGGRAVAPRVKLLAQTPDLAARLAAHPAFRAVLERPKSAASALPQALEAHIRAARLRPATAIAEDVEAALEAPGPYRAPIEVLAGELALELDPVTRLRATLQTVMPLLVSRPGATRPIADAKKLLAAPSPDGDALASATDALWSALGPDAAGLRPQHEPQIERGLVSRRAFSKGRFLGRERVRGTWVIDGANASLQVFLDETLLPKLALASRFRGRALVALGATEGPPFPEPIGAEILALAEIGR